MDSQWVRGGALQEELKILLFAHPSHSQAALVIKNPSANAGDIKRQGSIPGLVRSPGGGHGNTLHYSYLENPMDRGAWRATVHRVTQVTCCYAGQEATVRTGHGMTDCFQMGKGESQGCILSPCLFNLYAEYIVRNTGLEEAQAGIKIAGRNINNLRYADDTTIMAESKEN